MDLITGKALKQFNEWLFKTHGLYLYNVFNQTLLHAMIIDWLDSEGICVDVQPYVEIDETKRQPNIFFFPNVIDFTNLDNSIVSDNNYPSRHQAAQEAVKKAVYLYNERS